MATGAVVDLLGDIEDRLRDAASEVASLTQRLNAARSSSVGASDSTQAAEAEILERRLERAVKAAKRRLRSLELVVAACVGEVAATVSDEGPRRPDGPLRGAWAPPA